MALYWARIRSSSLAVLGDALLDLGSLGPDAGVENGDGHAGAVDGVVMQLVGVDEARIAGVERREPGPRVRPLGRRVLAPAGRLGGPVLVDPDAGVRPQGGQLVDRQPRAHGMDDLEPVGELAAHLRHRTRGQLDAGSLDDECDRPLGSSGRRRWRDQRQCRCSRRPHGNPNESPSSRFVGFHDGLHDALPRVQRLQMQRALCCATGVPTDGPLVAGRERPTGRRKNLLSIDS